MTWRMEAEKCSNRDKWIVMEYINDVPHATHYQFDTKAEAEAFILGWKMSPK